MDIIRPARIDESRLLSSNVPEDDHPAWAAGTTYAKGARCIRDRRIWQSAQDNNIGHDPLASPAGWWAEIGATNRWCMFDARVGTRTTAQGQIRVSLRPGQINALALLNVGAANVEVTLRAGGVTVYQRRASMVDAMGIRSWYDYFFEPIRERRDLVIDGIPAIGDAEVEVVLSRPSGAVHCGMLALGMRARLGRLLRSPQVSIVDYSKVVDDGFGGLTLVKGEWAKRAEVRMILPSRDVDYVQSLLAEYRATPLVWVGGARQSLTIYGKYDSFVIDIAYKTVSYCSLTIRGLV